MKRATCAVLILILTVFLVKPLPSDARGGHWGWWAPWAIMGGAAVLAHSYYASRPVVIREQTPVYVLPAPSVVEPATAERIFIYPRKGQSEELQAKDRYECHRWAVSQTGYDPTLPTGRASEAQTNQIYADYQRAQGACLDAREYTVK